MSMPQERDNLSGGSGESAASPPGTERPNDGTSPVPAITVDRLSVRLGEKQVLADVSLHVARGEYLAVIGPNGAGKTTLLKCIDRILRFRSGRIEIDGRPLASYRQKELARRISYVPQADDRAVPFSVEQFVLMGRYPHLSPFSSLSADDRRAVREAMELTEVTPLADRQMSTLSGGERQKVFIAAALAQGADVLLLDEPTTFLDFRHQVEIGEVLWRANRQQGLTLVAVTHDLNTAALHSDRVVALRGGRVVFAGSPREVMRPEVLRTIYGTELLLVDHPQTGLPVVVPRPPGLDGNVGDRAAADRGTGSRAAGDCITGDHATGEEQP